MRRLRWLLVFPIFGLLTAGCAAEISAPAPGKQSVPADSAAMPAPAGPVVTSPTSTDPLLQVTPDQVDLSKDVTTSSPGLDAAFQGFDSRSPQVADPMPDFTLQNLNGESVSLSQFRGKSAVLVVTGAASCFVYRQFARPNIANLQEMSASITATTGRTLEVLLVHVKEAHPALDMCPYTGRQWTGQANVDDKVLVREPTSQAERLVIAKGLADRYELDPSRILMDELDYSVWAQLGSVPNSLHLVDLDGKVVFKEAWAFNMQSDDAQRTPVVVNEVRHLLQP
jgi:hypothetical protein